MTEKSHLPHITLIGDPEENFYQLGLKDRESYGETLHHMEKVLRTPWEGLDRVIQTAVGKLGLMALKNAGNFYKHIRAYSEGLGEKQERIAFSLLLPEIISLMSKWLPNLSHSLYGCSSFFYWDSRSEAPLHGRILDFPLIHSFEKHERLVSYNFKNKISLSSVTTTGMPYPSLTTISEEGLTLAIHQKFTDVFNPKGTPIFEYVYDMLTTCGDKKSIINYIKTHPSLTTWGLYISFKNGDVISADVLGEKFKINTHELEEGKILYFNNMPECLDMHQDKFSPAGIKNYCNTRWDYFRANHGKKDHKNLNAEKLLELMASPSGKMAKTASKWDLPPITFSSVGAYVMNGKQGEWTMVPGIGPKYFVGESLTISNIFAATNEELKKRKSKFDKNYIEGLRHLAFTQRFHDLGDTHKSFHSIQMAMTLLKDYPEYHIARFYFLILEYLHETHSKIVAKLLNDFTEILPDLPEYFQDHTRLFIMRLERILGHQVSIHQEEIVNGHLKEVYAIERNASVPTLAHIYKKIISPRIEILDVIYPYPKIET